MKNINAYQIAATTVYNLTFADYNELFSSAKTKILKSVNITRILFNLLFLQTAFIGVRYIAFEDMEQIILDQIKQVNWNIHRKYVYKALKKNIKSAFKKYQTLKVQATKIFNKAKKYTRKLTKFLKKI